MIDWRAKYDKVLESLEVGYMKPSTRKLPEFVYDYEPGLKE